MNRIKTRWQSWRLKYTTILLLSLVVFYFVAQLDHTSAVIRELSLYGYWGAFAAGIFFVSAYTAVPAAYVLFELGNYLNPFEIALFGGLGAVVGDYLIFRFVRDQLYEELKPHFKWFDRFRNKRRQRSRLLKVLMPTLGMIIIASPIPDEIGVGMLGLARMNTLTFVAITFVLNTVGIFALAYIAQSI
jgi:uncharacterized membrane protein YdjX (TVP38/TMEM64 family)